MTKKKNHKFRLLWMKSKKSSSVLEKFSVKDIVLPEVLAKDTSTVSYVKRIGGQVAQYYSLHNYEFVEDIPPVETPGEEVLEDFDFAVLRYRWFDKGGRDLDIRAFISQPDHSSTVIGWNRSSNDGTYLIWSGDNTADGVETLLFDVKALSAAYPTQEKILVTLAAFWYNSVGTGDVTMEYSSFKGGTMTPSGFDFVNDQGVAVQTLSLLSNTQSRDREGIGSILAYLEYDTIKKTGRLFRPRLNLQALVTIARSENILTAEVTDANGVPNEIAYQWYLNSIEIPSANEKIYTPNTSGLYSVRATFIDREEFNESVLSLPVPIEIIVTPPTVDFERLPIRSYVTIQNNATGSNNTFANFAIEINGVLYNEEKDDLNMQGIVLPVEDLYFYTDSGGTFYINSSNPNLLNIKLFPSEIQKEHSKEFRVNPWAEPPETQESLGVVLPDGTFMFRLQGEIYEE